MYFGIRKKNKNLLTLTGPLGPIYQPRRVLATFSSQAPPPALYSPSLPFLSPLLPSLSQPATLRVRPNRARAQPPHPSRPLLAQSLHTARRPRASEPKPLTPCKPVPGATLTCRQEPRRATPAVQPNVKLQPARATRADQVP